MDDLITEIMRREGWDKYTNDPDDLGGPTKWGITQKAYAAYLGMPPHLVDVSRIEEQEARDFYLAQYVLRPQFHRIINHNLRELVVDCGVNHGTSRASRWLQRAAEVYIDGVVGPMTIAAVNAKNPLELFLEVLAYRVRFYGRIVSRNRSQAKFISGWNNRAAGFLEAAADRIAGGHQPV